MDKNQGNFHLLPSLTNVKTFYFPPVERSNAIWWRNKEILISSEKHYTEYKKTE